MGTRSIYQQKGSSMSITRGDTAGQFELIWNALECYREDCISTDNEEWDEICTVMAWLMEDMGCDFDKSTGDIAEVHT